MRAPAPPRLPVPSSLAPPTPSSALRRYDAAQNAAMQTRLQQFGVASDLIDERELAYRFPHISPEPFPTFDDEGNEVATNHGAFSAVYEHGCGHLDSSTCLTDLLSACRRDGIDVRFNQRVESFETSADGARCVGVRMEDGTVVGAGSVVNSSGPWFNKLNATVGVKLSTEALPTRIQVGHKYVDDEFCNLPFVADGWGPSGIYFMPRAANNQLVFGSVRYRDAPRTTRPTHATPPRVSSRDSLHCRSPTGSRARSSTPTRTTTRSTPT